ncbi:uncharacterized protein LOC115995843 [Ipomoea triloba]|uniref:uncharacterized protein LOC115995843 n=1 Tax=Ipomoea triloba TaxID=35885 RepID=UPI00125D43FC|nr:uncharacterized protein LOC115995843 [Ipomoea triloba]
MDLVSKKKPDFLFLMETKDARTHAECLRVKLGFESLFYVDSVGLNGGLALFWRRNCTARLLCYSKNHIDVEVSVAGFECWRMMCFYGYPERNRRSDSWELLRSLLTSSDLPWVVIGDFNDLLFQHEKRGGNPHPDALLRGFGEAVEDCGLSQLPLRGYQFTWDRGKGTADWMEERLDKVFANERWRGLQEVAIVENLLTRTSNHSALFLNLSSGVGRRSGMRGGFKFEMAWLLDEGCRGVVENAWQEGRAGGLLHCLHHCGERLHRWGGDRFYNFGKQMKQLRDAQYRLRGLRDPVSLAEFSRLENLITQLEAEEDVYWRQRAKQHWLQGADANTRFYHRYASARKKKNYLSRLKNDAGEWVEGDLLKPDDNALLLRPFEMSEVKEALFSMFPDKAPGLDGMNPGFYQHYWDVVGGDVSDFVLGCLNSCSFPEGLNATNVVLIPKKKVPERVSDLRPIALCNVVYKIMAKILANRMKRLITDNILVAAEVGHYLNRKQTGLAGWGALKLDMAKAYDRMEWPFLERMLRALGFNDKWVELIMLCVSTVSYSFLINGSPSADVVPSRGLRQGDPLSPYLFIICAEGISLLLQKAQADGSIRGANAQEAGAVKHCLDLYESMSGQAVNYHKSSVCFSRNTHAQHREEVVGLLGVTQAPNFGKYLGLPAFVGRNRKQAFSYIEDKIKQRILSWNKRLLTQAGKEVLLKSVAQAMPTFSMSVFLLPDSVCTSLERTMNRYWWGSGTVAERRIHWKAWDRLCLPKKFGGLGFKDLRAFNLAMLGKQAWRFLTKPTSLVAKVYKARYYPKTSFIDAFVGGCPSYCWRSIMAAHGLICSGVRRRIGDGENTLIWGHPWLPDDPSPMIQTPMPEHLNGSVVAGLIDNGSWDYSVLNDIFDPQDVEHISRIKIPPKWKTFLWRALTNTLPVTTNLVIRRVEVDLECPKCGLDHETIVHALISCDYAQQVWNESGLTIPPHEDGSFTAWFSSLMRGLTGEEVRLAAALLYHLWRARNSAVWDGCLQRPGAVKAAAVATLQAWRAVHGGEAAADEDSSTTNTPPALPPSTLMQCYFDASYCTATMKAAFGIVLLTAEGTFVSACAGPLPDCFSPLMAEALACKEATSWIHDRGLTHVAFYTDCSQLRSLITQAAFVRSHAGFAVETCRAFFSSFSNCVIHSVSRTVNGIAHSLAATAYSQTTTLYWDSIPPDSISALLA